MIICFLLFFSSSYIANYNTTVNEAWLKWKYIIYFCFTLLIFILKKEVIILISKTGYKVVLYLLINYFIDEYLNYNSWSINDLATIILILIEFIKKNT